jgi:hypothetical protein
MDPGDEAEMKKASMSKFRVIPIAFGIVSAVLPVASLGADEAGLSGLLPPPSPPALASPMDPEAPWCTDAEAPDRGPNGLLMRQAGLVLRLCKDEIEGSGPDRMRVNDARIPGLTFDLYAGQVKLQNVLEGDLGTYEHGLRISFGTHTAHGPAPDDSRQLDHLVRHERHGGALYEVWQNPDPRIVNLELPDRPEIYGPSPYPGGNLYVFVHEPGTASLPRHHVDCSGEPRDRWLKDDAGSCFIWVDYRGRQGFVQLVGSGAGYAEDSRYAQMHPTFPHYARDIHTLLSAVDVTDDPDAQDCVGRGGDWKGAGFGCIDP